MSGAETTSVALPAEAATAFAWRNAPHLTAVMGALDAAQAGASRYVGGCVRDSLLGLTPKDFDIATRLRPDAVMQAAKAAGLRTAPTGIAHGTVTVIARHKGVEVTTLRADVTTDGRRATVSFTDDWTVDAGRRDFTINALYLSGDGVIHDSVGGLRDIKIPAVRFIGEPEQRIREDYLRILRFFRFSARFAENYDPAGLAAVAALKEGVPALSAERIGMEFMAILDLPQATFALQGMEKTGVLKTIWPSSPDLGAVARLKALAPDAPAPVVLGALYGASGEGVGAALRLSKAEEAMRRDAVRAAERVAPGLSGNAVRVLIYELGPETVAHAAALAASFGRINEPDFTKVRAMTAAWTPARFPLSGRDVIAAGVEKGPVVARILKAVEAAWTAEDFPNEARVREILAQEIAKTGE